MSSQKLLSKQKRMNSGCTGTQDIENPDQETPVFHCLSDFESVALRLLMAGSNARHEKLLSRLKIIVKAENYCQCPKLSSSLYSVSKLIQFTFLSQEWISTIHKLLVSFFLVTKIIVRTKIIVKTIIFHLTIFCLKI